MQQDGVECQMSNRFENNRHHKGYLLELYYTIGCIVTCPTCMSFKRIIVNVNALLSRYNR